MYLDAVINSKTYNVIFNNTPEATRAYVERMDEDRRKSYHVTEGSTMHNYSIEEYLAK